LTPETPADVIEALEALALACQSTADDIHGCPLSRGWWDSIAARIRRVAAEAEDHLGAL
jgi:hypothetical protein